MDQQKPDMRTSMSVPQQAPPANPPAIDDAQVIDALKAIVLDLRGMIRVLNATVDYLTQNLRSHEVENRL